MCLLLQNQANAYYSKLCVSDEAWFLLNGHPAIIIENWMYGVPGKFSFGNFGSFR